MLDNSEAITSQQFKLLQFESLNQLVVHKALNVHSQTELPNQPFPTLSLSVLEVLD